MKSTEYNFSKIEPKWQKYWSDNKTFYAKDLSVKNKFYILDMFPYPSGSGLHIGHPEGYTASDAFKRFKKAQGFNVLHPMGWDAFGLPTEQYAIKTGKHPEDTTIKNVERFKSQLKQIGLTYDWNREINTTNPEYFKWTQWIFLQLFKKGLAYVEEKPVWFCPELGTVLANEEVIQSKEGPISERGSHPVIRRPIRQWVLKITNYADQLLNGLKDLDWPESTKKLQSNWIGKSKGTKIRFQIKSSNDSIEVFTTRPDTIFGVSYLVLAPEHNLVKSITNDKFKNKVELFIEKSKNKSELDRTELNKDKKGVNTGAFAINPINQKIIPIWISDYVLPSYGTGAVMAVPAHDERDFEFAKKYNLNIIEVIQGSNKIIKENSGKVINAYTGNGKLINSDKFNGLDSKTASKKITDHLININKASTEINYKLRDWLFSRQRYWGEPFPIVWVSADDYKKVDLKYKPENNTIKSKFNKSELYAIAINEDNLPVKLPSLKDYNPNKEGLSPLGNAKEWLNIFFDLTNGKLYDSPNKDRISATRETNTMPQWAGSCWYYLRYIDPNNSNNIISKDLENYWGSPDLYIGGSEHAVLHLLYARFWHRFLYDIDVVTNKEPFKKLFHQGIILGEDGEKMSKSRGNVVNPETIIDSYGADTLRLYLMFLGPLEAMKPWNTKGIEGVSRFLRKLWRLIIVDEQNVISEKIKLNGAIDNHETEKLLHESIQKVTKDYESLSFNTIISQLMILLNHLNKLQEISVKTIETFLKLLSPLAPHITEEIWFLLGNKKSISDSSWPVADTKKITSDKVKIIFQVNGKYKGDKFIDKGTSKERIILFAKSNEKVSNSISKNQILKEIYVPNKIVNIVTK